MKKSIFELWVEIGVWDKTGKLIYKKREPSRSPVEQLLQILLVQFDPGQPQTIKDTGGTDRTVGDHASNFDVTGALNDDTHGIVVGTDDTAVDITDNALGTQIAHGSGAGQMVYNANVEDASVTTSDPDAYFELYRNFNNNSGGSITVKETGIYCKMSTAWYGMLVRDVPTEVAVPDGGGCYVLYRLKITE